MRYESVSVSGTVGWNGDILLEVTLGRVNREDKWVDDVHLVEVGVDNLACARRTLRGIAEEALAQKERNLRAEEDDLADS